MTDIPAHLDSLNAYVRYIADHMALKDWQLIADFDERLDSPAAIECVQNRRYAVIRVSDAFFAATDQEQRHFVVHELVHCHLDPHRSHYDTLAPIHGTTAHVALKLIHDNLIESTTDALASAIAQGMPTPGEFETRP